MNKPLTLPLLLIKFERPPTIALPIRAHILLPSPPPIKCWHVPSPLQQITLLFPPIIVDQHELELIILVLPPKIFE
jgi:hypothetical protein